MKKVVKSALFFVVFAILGLLYFGGNLLKQESVVFAETDVVFSAIDGTQNSKQSENYDKALDGKKTSSDYTKWCYEISQSPYIVIKASQDIVVTGYIFTVGNDNADATKGAGRNPKDWTLSASTDYNETSKTGTWQTIDTKTGDETMQDVNFADYTFSMSSNRNFYKYFKFQFTAVQGASATLFQLCEIELVYSTTCLGHSYTAFENGTEATCTTAGIKGHKTCTYCGKYFDNEGNEISDLTIAIDENNHSLGEIEKDETKHWKTCSLCNNKIGEEDHHGGQATCSGKAKCEDCQTEYGTTNTSAHSLGDWVNEVPATCSEAGTKGHKTCSLCNKNFDNEGNEITDLTIEKLQHDFQNIQSNNHVKKSGTCTKGGEYYESCSVCGERGTQTFVGDPIGHDVNSSGQCVLCARYIGTIVGNFGVIGGTNGVDYEYESNTLSILTSTALTITQIDIEKSITDTILIKKDVQANITLAEINIDVSSQANKSAIVIEEGSAQSVSITIKENTTTILKSHSSCAGIKRNSHTQSLVINNDGNLLISSGAAAIDGGYVSTGVKDVVLDGGYIKLSGSPKFGNSTKTLVPVNSAGENLYEFEIQNSSKKTISIDGTNVNSNYHNSSSGESYFTFITGSTHTIKVGTDTTVYHYSSSAFSPCAAGTEYGQDETEHWKKCFFEGCDEKYECQTHNYSQQIKTADYLRSEATCTQNRTYYYSCSCGKKSSDADDYFSDSDTKLGHNYIKEDESTNWTGNDDCHWKVCLRCSYENKSDFGLHTFDKKCGTCTCTICGKVVEKDHNILRENHLWKNDETSHWYGCYFRTDNCDVKDSEAPHDFRYVASSDDGYHIKRCSVCWYEDQSSKQACTIVVVGREEQIHILGCETCGIEDRREYHNYTNVCDVDCDTCGKERVPEHEFDNSCDTECNLCHAMREPSHVYDNDCDEICNNCEHTRTVEHNFGADWEKDEFEHYHLCEDCWTVKDMGAHVYDNNQDLECNTCGYVRGEPITEVKLFLTGYRFGNEVNRGHDLYSYTDKIQGNLDTYFSTDARMIEFGENFDDYIIKSYSAFFEDKEYYFCTILEPRYNDETNSYYDISSLLAENIKLVVNGTTVTAQNIAFRKWGGDPCAFVGFKLPKLEMEEFNKVDADLNFKLTGYEFGNKAEDISVVLLSEVTGINFSSEAAYGDNFFITTAKYPDEMFSKMIDGKTALEKNKDYYLGVVFNSQRDYFFDRIYNNEFTLQGCGYHYSLDYSNNECMIIFRLHPLGATKINNLNFTYSGYEVDQKITDITVDYTQATGINTGTSYFDEEEYEYNYFIVTDLEGFMSDDSDEYYVSRYDNGRFVANKQYYLVMCIVPESNQYSLEDFESATVTFGGQNATQKVLVDAGYAYAIHQLPILTTEDSVQKITEFSVTISNYQIGKKIADLTFDINTTFAEAIAFGGEKEIESVVRMEIHDTESSAWSIWGVGSEYTLTASHKYTFDFIIKAKDGISFLNLTKNNVFVTAQKTIYDFHVSAGGGYLEFSVELRLLSDYHEHNFTNAEEDFALKTPATCENNAEYYKSCSCGELSTQTFVKENSKLDHSISSSWTKTESGHFHACINGCAHQEDFAAHTPNIAAATQDEAQVCSICGYVIAPMLSHTHSLTKHEKVDATCVTAGTKAYYSCSGCEQKFEDEQGLSPITNFETWVVTTGEHNFGEWTAEVPATCLTAGTKAHKTCSTCHKHFDQTNVEILNLSIAKLTHQFDTHVERTWPTCSTVGTKSHWHCSLCNKNYDYFEVELTDTTIPTNSNYHSFELVKAVAETCLTNGIIAHLKCSECNKLFNMSYAEISDPIIYATGHNFGDWEEIVPATCSAAGTLAHKTCSKCNKHFDADEKEIASLTIQKLEHSLGELEKDETKHWKTCTACGDIIGEENHHGGQATCSGKAKCEDCQTEYGTTNTSAHSLGEWVNEVPATCSEAGTKGHKTCSLCNKHFDDKGFEIADLTIEVDSTAHNFGDWEDAVPATCMTVGVKGHKTCSKCNKHFDQNDVEITDINISAAAHEFGEWIDEVAPTTESEGTKGHKTCLGCHKHFDESGNQIVELSIKKLENQQISDDKKLSGGAIAGIVIASVVVLNFATFAIIWFVIKKKRFSDLKKLLRKI